MQTILRYPVAAIYFLQDYHTVVFAGSQANHNNNILIIT